MGGHGATASFVVAVIAASVVVAVVTASVVVAVHIRTAPLPPIVVTVIGAAPLSNLGR
jgi:hypothetical protein